jgi:hypothetical protein
MLIIPFEEDFQFSNFKERKDEEVRGLGCVPM